MNKYAMYIKERENAELYEDEHGFFAYKFEDGYGMITELYVLPEYRGNKVGSKYVDIMDGLSLENNIKTLFCNSCKDANNWEDSHEFILASGYNELETVGNMVYYRKDL